MSEHRLRWPLRLAASILALAAIAPAAQAKQLTSTMTIKVTVVERCDVSLAPDGQTSTDGCASAAIVPAAAPTPVVQQQAQPVAGTSLQFLEITY